MRNSILIAGFAVAGLAAGGLWLLNRPEQPAARTASADSPAPADPHRATAATEPSPSAAGDAVKLPLDCTKPQGDAARFRGGPVTVADLCGRYQLRAGKQGGVAAAIERTQARQILDQMIDQRLVAAALAEDHTAVSDAEVESELDHLQQRPGQAGQVPLAKALLLEGVDIQTVRSELRWRLEMARLLQLRGSDQLGAGEVEREFLQHPERYALGGGARVRPFLLRVAPNAPPPADAKAKAQAQAFASAVAKTVPEKLPPTVRLPELPPFVVEPNDSEPELGAELAKVKVGQWSAPVRIRAGWLVCQLIEVTAGAPHSLEQARPAIEQRLRAGQRQADQARILAALRQAAAIELLVDL